MVRLESLAQDFSGVILSLDEWLASDIINTVLLWWVEFGVVGSSTIKMDSSSFDSFNQLLIRDLELEDLVDLGASLLVHLVEFLCLLDGSWETIKDHTLLAFRSSHFVLDEFNDVFIRDKSTLLHDFLDLVAELAAAADFSSQKITSREMADAVFAGQLWGLGSLATSRRTEENDSSVWVEGALVSSEEFIEDCLIWESGKVDHFRFLNN
mmetsp:Transcript_36520/g.42639  ORF Transcript_36520/g.42639 Transcript_36520/m.42639 type:complete len:210 (+) Transcript_36520:308-937(+)